MFMVIKKIIREVRSAAHLCPPKFIGEKISRTIWTIVQACTVRCRLFDQRLEEERWRAIGKMIAIVIRLT